MKLRSQGAESTCDGNHRNSTRLAAVSVTIFIVLNMANEILSEGECFSLKHLAINGGDLISNGFEAGKQIGEILDFLLEEVICGRAENDKNILLKIAKSKYGE